MSQKKNLMNTSNNLRAVLEERRTGISEAERHCRCTRWCAAFAALGFFVTLPGLPTGNLWWSGAGLALSMGALVVLCLSHFRARKSGGW